MHYAACTTLPSSTEWQSAHDTDPPRERAVSRVVAEGQSKVGGGKSGLNASIVMSQALNTARCQSPAECDFHEFRHAESRESQRQWLATHEQRLPTETGTETLSGYMIILTPPENKRT